MPARVEIYVRLSCPYCVRAMQLLQRKGVRYEEIDIDRQPERRAEMIQRAQGRRTVPQIFINDEGIGGCDELHMLDARGKLDARLAAAGPAQQ